MRSVCPEASERVYPGWHGLGFHNPDVGFFCGVFPLADSVRLLFEHGALLDDHDGLLTGGGSQTRYVELTPDSTIDRLALERLLVPVIHRH